MEEGKQGTERQLRRQAEWLRESWLWLFRTRVLGDVTGEEAVMTALDVGCGPGFVMDALGEELSVRGVDVDRDMVNACVARGLDVTQASAYELPYDDDCFDVVYCTFLLMWLDEPQRALAEMARVSRGWVLALAEPDFGARIDHPAELAEIRDLVIEGFRRRGADPFTGRKLRELFSWTGLTAEVGIHAGVWDVPRLRLEAEDEWRYLVRAAEGVDPQRLDAIRAAWDRALEAGTALSFNPIFYGLGRKGR